MIHRRWGGPAGPINRIPWAFGGLMIGLLLILGACAAPSSVTPVSTAVPAPSPTPAAWLHGTPCVIPCFEGITPGVTTYHEAYQILTTAPWVATVQPSVTGGWVWDSRDNRRNGAIDFLERPPIATTRVAAIGVGIGNIPFQEVLDVLGEPSDIIATQGDWRTENPGSPGIPDFRRTSSMMLVYRQHGMTVMVAPQSFAGSDASEEKPILTTTLRLTTPVFFDPTSDFTSVLNLDPAMVVPWDGWKGFDFYCRTMITAEPCQP